MAISESRDSAEVVREPALPAQPAQPIRFGQPGIVGLDALVFAVLAFGQSVAQFGSVAEGELFGAWFIVGAHFLVFATLSLAVEGYRPTALASFRTQARLVATAWVLTNTVLLLAEAVDREHQFVSGRTGVWVVVTGLGFMAWRYALAGFLAKALRKGQLAVEQILLIAEQSEIERFDTQALASAGYLPALVLTFDGDQSGQVPSLVRQALRLAQSNGIEGFFVLVPWDDQGRIAEIAAGLAALPLPVRLLPDQRTRTLFGQAAAGNAAAPFAEIVLRRAPLTTAQRTFKRGFDVLVAGLGLIVLAPVLALLAAIIRIDSRGPAFFWQTRNGLGGRPFQILKFRTMFVLEDTPVRQAVRNDPRVTRVGRWLRWTSADEVPQLWNVLKGEMSIVGPRPHPCMLNEAFEGKIPGYAMRHHVKPGLTGWAQVHGLRGETPNVEIMEQRVRFDLQYVNHFSILRDLLIVARTFRLVFGDPEAS